MAAPLPEFVRIYRVTLVADGHGGREPSEALFHAASAKMIFRSGGEAVQAGAVQASGVIKVKLRMCSAAKGIVPSDVLTDRDGKRYNIRAVDTVTDAAWVWLDVEFGVADGGAS